MKSVIKYLFILSIPFVIMIIVNESCRGDLKENPHNYLGVTTINSGIFSDNQCTWACHNSTANHCKKKHTKVIKVGFPMYQGINDIYEGIINFNSRKKNGQKVSDPQFYRGMNLAFLVFLWPLIMFLLLYNFLRLRKKSKATVL